MQLHYVSRGDPPLEDFYLPDLIVGGGWHPILKGPHYWPKGAELVLFKVQAKTTGAARGNFRMRSLGNVNAINVGQVKTQLPDIPIIAFPLVQPGPTNHIEYNANAVNWTAWSLTVRGWWVAY